MERYIQIEDEPNFVKDMQTNAILNTNHAQLIAHKEKKKQAAKILSMEQEINMLKAEIENIKKHLNLS